ncbi:hypothetical protein Fcan01_20368 [Folsomia candida]|uniref:C2H2-type domain-containing protein n=1 Tax=Folsomia candida TaxID=158441 RepID=A0A226DIS6_FOLCA|nr:hypothetical protein Fcan01_20368 [Folsomia candida]
MAQLNCLLCLDNVEGEHLALNYLNSTQIIHLYDLLIPKDRNSRQDLIANCPSENNYGFTLCQNCSFETTQIDQIKEQISQLEDDVRLKVDEIRRKMVHCPVEKELSPGLDGGSDSGDIQGDDLQVKVEPEEDYDYEDKHFLGDDNKVDISSPPVNYNEDDPHLTDFSHSSSDEESSSFLITPDNIKAMKKKNKNTLWEQKSMSRVSTKIKTIKKSNIPTSQRITRSSASQNREAKPAQISEETNSSEDIKPSKTELDDESSSTPKKIKGEKKPLKKYGKKKLPRFPCSLCSKICYEHCTLVTHMMTRHETKDKSHFCSKCNKGFTAEANLQRHFDLHAFDNTKPLACSVCDARFSDQERLDRHTLTHGRKYWCDRCGAEYNSKERFDSHVRTHTGERPYKCDQCPEAFIDYNGKKRHIDLVHSGTARESCDCPICGKKILTSSLKSHMELVHENKKNYSCDDCGEKFKMKDTLAAHRVKEHNADSIVCEECGGTFTTRRGLNRHKSNHNMELKYTCNTCGARFRAQHQLTYHVRSHAVGQEVICQHCSKAFKHAPHLVEHIKRIHTRDYVPKTPFECNHCKKRFASKKDRDCHIRQHHTGERPFVCHLCGKGYAVETTLTLHLKGVHQVDVQWKRATGWKKSKRDDFVGAKESEET